MYKLSVYAEGDLVQNTLKTSLIYTKNMENKKKSKYKIHYKKNQTQNSL